MFDARKHEPVASVPRQQNRVGQRFIAKRAETPDELRTGNSPHRRFRSLRAVGRTAHTPDATAMTKLGPSRMLSQDSEESVLDRYRKYFVNFVALPRVAVNCRDWRRGALSMRMAMYAGLFAVLCTASPGEARVTKIERTIPRTVATFCKNYIPATVLVNTRGKFVRAQRNYWVETEATYTRMREPALFFTTERVVEPDHVTLTPC